MKPQQTGLKGVGNKIAKAFIDEAMKDEAVKPKKPVHAKPSLYAYYFLFLKEIALKYGYNLVLHGSLNRDLDLIAIPWQEVIGDKKEMIEEMAAYLGGFIMAEPDDAGIRFKNAYHGRECYVINLNRGGKKTNYEDPQYYVDISVTPAI